jgi:hypothetical protein
MAVDTVVGIFDQTISAKGEVMSEAKPQQNQERQKARNGDVSVDDAFWLTDLYPDAAALIAHDIVELPEAVKDCIVVLDGNILLWPYDYSTASLKAVEDVYRRLADDKRLIVPGQAVREYYKHRSRKIAAIGQKIEGVISKSNHQIFDKISILEEDKDYKAARKVAVDIQKKGQEIANRFKAINHRLKNDVGADRVSALYRDVLKDCIIELPMDAKGRQELLDDAKRRSRLEIAPGFKDDSKADGGIGDLLIWKTLLSVAAERKCHAIFVTDEAKNDWWVRSNGAYHPRPELIEEYRAHSGGKSLHMMPLSGLLAAFESPTDVVQQALELEQSVKTPDFPKSSSHVAPSFLLFENTYRNLTMNLAAIQSEINQLTAEIGTIEADPTLSPDEKEALLSLLRNNVERKNEEAEVCYRKLAINSQKMTRGMFAGGRDQANASLGSWRNKRNGLWRHGSNSQDD